MAYRADLGIFTVHFIPIFFFTQILKNPVRSVIPAARKSFSYYCTQNTADGGGDSSDIDDNHITIILYF